MTQIGTEGLGLFESVKPVAPWDPQRFQPPQVTPPLAGASDPETSQIAAEAAFPSAQEQNKHITACLLGMGTKGGTAEQIADALNGGDPEGPWDSVIVSRRIAGLRLNHVFTFDGREGRPLVTRFGRSGRSMTVHVAKVAGRPIGNPPELDQRRTP